MPAAPDSPVEPLDPSAAGGIAATSKALADAGYLADEPASLVSPLAQRLGKPVLVEGPAGVGKTELAKALAALRDELIHSSATMASRAQALYYGTPQAAPCGFAESDDHEASGVMAHFAEEFPLTRHPPAASPRTGPC